VCCVSLTILEVMATEQFYWYTVGQFYTETEAMQIVVASTIRTRR